MLNLKQSFASLRRTPAFVAVVVTVLGIGLGANAAMFTLVERLLLHPVPYRDSDRLVQIGGKDRKGRNRDIAGASFQVWNNRVPAFESTAISRGRFYTITGVADAENVYTLEVSRSAFDILGVQPLFGRLFTAADFESDAPRVALLRYDVWQRHFPNDRGVLDREVMLDGQGFHVIGVMPPGFMFNNPLYQVWTPMPKSKDIAGELHHVFSGIARLRPGVTVAQAEKVLRDVAAAIPPSPDDQDGWIPTLRPYNEQFTENNGKPLMILWGAVGALLLVACANAANLLLARASIRRREYAVRAALGAGQWRLVRLVALECALLGAASVAVGLAFAYLALPLALRWLPSIGLLPEEQLTITPACALVTAGAAIVTALLCALPTAIDVLRANLLGNLGAGSRSVTSSRTSAALRSSLIAIEVALSIVLLIGAGLMLRSLSHLLDERRLGLETNHVLTAQVSSPQQMKKAPELSAYYQRVLDAVRGIPGVRDAAVVTILPFSNLDITTSFAAEGAKRIGHRDYPVHLRSVTPDYFHVLGVRVLRGRAFTDADTGDAPRVAIIDRSLADHFWPGENPVGRRVSRDEAPGKDGWYTVVGVVENTARASLTSQPEAELYRPFAQDATGARATTLVLRTPLDPLSLAGSVSRAIHTLNPEQPVSKVRPMATWLSDSARTPRLQAILLEMFSTLALAMAATGIFAVVSFAVAQRRQEIGIRSALGATAPDIAAFVLRLGLKPVLIGTATGLVATAAMVRVLESELFETPALDLGVYASVIGTLLATAVAAMLVPARRAASIAPSDILRID